MRAPFKEKQKSMHSGKLLSRSAEQLQLCEEEKFFPVAAKLMVRVQLENEYNVSRERKLKVTNGPGK